MTSNPWPYVGKTKAIVGGKNAFTEREELRSKS